MQNLCYWNYHAQRERERQEEEMGAEVTAAVEVKRWDKRKLRKSNRLP